MPAYLAFGLRLESPETLPGLVSCAVTGPADALLHLREWPSWLSDAGISQRIWYVGPPEPESQEPLLTVRHLSPRDYFWLRFWDGTEFLLDRRATQIWTRWPPGLTLEDTLTYLLGPVFGFIMLLRGFTVLHASAVCVEGEAIALLGSQGAGKSTTAACFAEMGVSVLCDDVLALSTEDSEFQVRPAYPRLRLWPSSVRLLYESEEALPRLTPTWEKRFLDLTGERYRYETESRPLSAVYVLADRVDGGEAPRVAAIPAKEVLLKLIGNAYAAKLYDKPSQARDFEVLGQLANRIPVREVIPSSNPRMLRRMCESILEDFGRVRQGDLARQAASTASPRD